MFLYSTVSTLNPAGWWRNVKCIIKYTLEAAQPSAETLNANSHCQVSTCKVSSHHCTAQVHNKCCPKSHSFDNYHKEITDGAEWTKLTSPTCARCWYVECKCSPFMRIHPNYAFPFHRLLTGPTSVHHTLARYTGLSTALSEEHATLFHRSDLHAFRPQIYTHCKDYLVIYAVIFFVKCHLINEIRNSCRSQIPHKRTDTVQYIAMDNWAITVKPLFSRASRWIHTSLCGKPLQP